MTEVAGAPAIGPIPAGLRPRPGLGQATALKLIEGGSFDGFFNEFGSIVETGNMTSDEVLKFYRALTIDYLDVIENAVAVLDNGTEVEMEEASILALPNNEAGDCPTLKVPDGLMGVAEIR